jgi:hypothetical protein
MFSLQGGETREIMHYLYTGWPDHGVPQNASWIFYMRQNIKNDRMNNKIPILVHCRYIKDGLLPYFNKINKSAIFIYFQFCL